MTDYSNTSQHAGYLTSATPQLDDADLERVLQVTIAGVTGIAANLVRRAFQPTTPTRPANGVNWIAFQVLSTEPTSSTPEMRHNHNTDVLQQTSTVINYEMMEVRVSIYGPNAQGITSTLRTGLTVGQNRAAWKSAGLAYQSASKPVALPELGGDTNQQAQRRFDTVLTFMRRTERVYAIRSVADVVFVAHKG